MKNWGGDVGKRWNLQTKTTARTEVWGLKRAQHFLIMRSHLEEFNSMQQDEGVTGH